MRPSAVSLSSAETMLKIRKSSTVERPLCDRRATSNCAKSSAHDRRVVQRISDVVHAARFDVHDVHDVPERDRSASLVRADFGVRS
jgi:hypothetical protein